MKNWRQKLRGSEFKVMRLCEGTPADFEIKLENPKSIVDYLFPRLADSLLYRPDVENLMVVHLNTRFKAIGFEVVSNGTLDTILTHPREVFKSAIVANSHSIILCHNHPSGDPKPSDADIKVTRDLCQAGKIIRIGILDHIILTADRFKWHSLRQLGHIGWECPPYPG